MRQPLKSLLLSLFLLFQALPVIILLFFWYHFNNSTQNSGWIYDKRTGCKYFTQVNFENRSFTWNGICQKGYAHGQGELTLFQNNKAYYIFEGALLRGRIKGMGTLTWLTDGDTYEGHFQNGLLNGFGHFYDDDGDHYEGYYENGLRSGKGTYWYVPESPIFKYAGEWKADKENGKGTLFYRDGKRVSGSFKEGFLVK